MTMVATIVNAMDTESRFAQTERDAINS